MVCPHCGIGTSPNFRSNNVGEDQGRSLMALGGNCTECGRLIVLGEFTVVGRGDSGFPERVVAEQVPMFPRRTPPRPTPPDLPEDYAEDFREAALVLEDSPKASAALSRRLLQRALREKGGFSGRNLEQEIQAAIDSGTLPSDLAADLDALRTIGNFAAHPIKGTNTGEVVGVEPDEARWLLNLLDELLQHYFTRPAVRARRRNDLNAKLSEAGKPELKGTPPPPVLGGSSP